MSDFAAVEFEHVFKAFGNRKVLEDVLFKINAGEALCILGRSGTGAKRACAASTRRHRKLPAAACASGRPAESSMAIFQRAISEATRRARLRSGGCVEAPAIRSCRAACA